MPNDAAYQEAKKRGIQKIRTIHPDPKRPDLFIRVYVVRKAGARGGHTVRGRVQKGNAQVEGAGN